MDLTLRPKHAEPIAHVDETSVHLLPQGDAVIRHQLGPLLTSTLVTMAGWGCASTDDLEGHSPSSGALGELEKLPTGDGADGHPQITENTEPICELPRTFKWKSTGPLIAPKSPAGHDFVSIKDPSIVQVDGVYHVYATVFDKTANAWSAVYMNFTDWTKAGAAPQFHMANSPARNTVAPQQFYFAPKKKWVLVYQWGASYATSNEPGNPQSWSRPTPLIAS